jgi:hypothetical protein
VISLRPKKSASCRSTFTCRARIPDAISALAIYPISTFLYRRPGHNSDATFYLGCQTSAVIELLKALIEHVLGWPVATVILGLIFRRPVGSFLRRIHKLHVKGPGVEFTGEARKQLDADLLRRDPLTAPTEAQLVLPLNDDIAERRRAVESFGGDSPSVLANIKDIRETLETLRYPLADAGTSEVLIRHLAVTQLMHRAEALYRLIFGSQLDAMHVMNQQGPQPESVIAPYFERAKSRSPKFYRDFGFDQWVGFLVQQQLVVIENERYGITVLGREFLRYLTTVGLPRKAH